MIDLDIIVPYFGKKYDFHLDETVPIMQLTEEIVEMISNSEHFTAKHDNRFRLFSQNQKRALDEEDSLDKSGVNAGDTLILC